MLLEMVVAAVAMMVVTAVTMMVASMPTAMVAASAPIMMAGGEGFAPRPKRRIAPSAMSAPDLMVSMPDR